MRILVLGGSLFLSREVALAALARGHELVLRKPVVGPGFPVVEERRLDLGHPGTVWVRFGRHILSRVAGRLDGRQELGEVVAARRIHVHDVQ
jgi:nucleoside-diphosphate-sugar epimerase